MPSALAMSGRGGPEKQLSDTSKPTSPRINNTRPHTQKGRKKERRAKKGDLLRQQKHNERETATDRDRDRETDRQADGRTKTYTETERRTR